MSRGTPPGGLRRPGIVATLAGPDVRTGQVTVVVRRRRRHQELLALLQDLRRRRPRDRLIIVPDNLSMHTHPNALAWVADPQHRAQLVSVPLMRRD